MDFDRELNRSPEEVEALYQRIVAEKSVGRLAGLSALRQEIHSLMGKAVACTPVTVEQTAIVEEAIAKRPYLNQQLVSTYQTDGLETLVQLFDHPVVQVSESTLQMWFDY